MPADVYRDSRYYHNDSSSDDERYRRNTVRRYKVKSPSGHSERIDRYDRTEEVDDDRRSRYSAHTGLEADRGYVPERPRSAFVERDVQVYREREVDRPREPVREWERPTTGAWEFRDGDAEVRVEKHVERQPDGDVLVSRRVEEHRDLPHGEVDRYRKETEFYAAPDPPPVPVVIRQQAPEQRIIVQEAPPPAPIIVNRSEPQYTIVRDRDYRDDDYYRRGKWDDDYALAAYGRRRSDRDYASDGESDGELYYRRTVITRDRSDSDHHHKRHLAEGALAGAGAAALLASRPNRDGQLPENRGRKVLAGAALGAIGTEAARRAKSAFEDRYVERHRSRSRSHDRHNKIKTGLGIAAAALAVAGAAKYYQSSKVEKEEMNRGRPLRRNSYGEYYDDHYHSSRSRSQKRSSSVAKMGLGAAAAAGIAQHMRNKSRERSGKRSRSRVKTGAEIVAAGLAGAGIGKMMDKRKERKSRSRSRGSVSSAPDEFYDRGHSRSRSRSRLG